VQDVPSVHPEDRTLIHILAPQYMVEAGLETTIRSAINNSGLAGGLEVQLDAYPTPGPMFMCIGPDLPFLFPDSPLETEFPDLMLVDSQAVYQLDPSRVSEVPPDIQESAQLTDSALWAYTDLDGRRIGLAQGTRPVMLVHNRDRFGENIVVQELASGEPPILSWEKMTDLLNTLEENHIGVPPMAALIAAEIQGMDRNPEEIFDHPGLLLELANLYGNNAEKILDYTVPFDPGQIQPFEDPQSAFAVVDSGYLGQLANSGFQVDVLPLPSLASGQPATSTQMLGWIVPEKASHPDLAWQLAGILVNNEEMNRFGMPYGLLPVTAHGIENLEEWGQDVILLPGNIQTLKDLAYHSVAWHIPARFRTAECRQKFNDFMMESDQIVVRMAEGSYNGYDAAKIGAQLLDALLSCKP
jgi:hypothetical protein